MHDIPKNEHSRPIRQMNWIAEDSEDLDGATGRLAIGWNFVYADDYLEFPELFGILKLLESLIGIILLSENPKFSGKRNYQKLFWET